MEYYDLSLNDLSLIRHLRKSRETFIRFTYNKNIQEKVEVGRLRRAVNKDISNKVCNIFYNNRKTKVSIDLLRDLLTQSQSTEDKIRLFNIYQNDIDNSELKNIIQILGNPYSDIIEGKHPKFENNEYNREFINQRKKDFITKSDFIDKGKFIKVHTKRKTKLELT